MTIKELLQKEVFDAVWGPVEFNSAEVAILPYHQIIKKNWSDERVEQGKLGYNDAQQLVILKSNVPTYTITPIWLVGGKYKGRDWIPLFNRTDKKV